MLKLITTHLSKHEEDLVPGKPKKHKKTLRIYNNSRYSIMEQPDATATAATATSVKKPYSDTYINRSSNNNNNNKKTSITSQSFFSSDKDEAQSNNNNDNNNNKQTTSTTTTTTTQQQTTTSSTNNTKQDEGREGECEEEEQEEDDNTSFARGIHVSRSGRFREKARVRGRVFSLDGLSLLSVDDSIVEQRNEEHLRDQANEASLSQQQFSFLNEDLDNRQPPLSLAQCKEFGEVL